MANAFKNASLRLTTGLVDIYEVPANKTAVIHAVFFTNIHASNAVTVDLLLRQASAAPGSSALTTYIVKTVDLPNKSTLVLDKPINMVAGDQLEALCSAATSADCSISILEIT